MDGLGRILLVEDDPKDIDLTLAALEEYKLANEVVVVRDGAEALDYLHMRGNYRSRARENPAVVLLDLKLPKVDGLEVLQEMRSDEKAEAHPRRGAHLLPRRKGHGGELQARRERLRGEAGRLPRVRQRRQGARRLLGRDQRAAARERRQEKLKWIARFACCTSRTTPGTPSSFATCSR